MNNIIYKNGLFSFRELKEIEILEVQYIDDYSIHVILKNETVICVTLDISINGIEFKNIQDLKNAL